MASLRDKTVRKMPVQLGHLEESLKPLGFILTAADRGRGSNDVELLRPSPSHLGLFEKTRLGAPISGSPVWIHIGVSIGSFYFFPCTITRTLSIDAEPPFLDRLHEIISSLFSGFYADEGEDFYKETKSARNAAERYLTLLKASSDLDETLARLRQSASKEQLDRAQDFMRGEHLETFHIEEYHTVHEIASLCQILYWEFPERPFKALQKSDATKADIEADRRFQIVASRLARAPGWPIHDSLVPIRKQLCTSVPWRDWKPTGEGEICEEYLVKAEKLCECGKLLHYMEHKTISGTLSMRARCNNGHEMTLTLKPTS